MRCFGRNDICFSSHHPHLDTNNNRDDTAPSGELLFLPFRLTIDVCCLQIQLRQQSQWRSVRFACAIDWWFLLLMCFYAIPDEITNDNNDTNDSCKCCVCGCFFFFWPQTSNIVASPNSESSMHDLFDCDAVCVVDVCMCTDVATDVPAARARRMCTSANNCVFLTYCVIAM